MGYTHYWEQDALAPEEMIEIGDSIREIIAASGVTICGWDGTGEPTITDETISFNGAGEDGHETFSLTPGWQFCKTAHKPYDIVVTACLAYLAHNFNFKVSSDGRADEWQPGVELARKALHYSVPNPLIDPIDEKDLFSYAEQRREGEIGMERAVDHADREVDNWSVDAGEYLRSYAKAHDQFMAEDMRAWAHEQGLPQPPDLRAWGAVFQRGSRGKIIAKTGEWRPVLMSGHASRLGPVWRSI